MFIHAINTTIQTDICPLNIKFKDCNQTCSCDKNVLYLSTIYILVRMKCLYCWTLKFLHIYLFFAIFAPGLCYSSEIFKGY